jgi:TolA-binding protein
MSGNDLTKNHTDGMTRPTIETVLERINAVGDTLASHISELAKEVRNNNSAIAQLRSEVEQGFRRVERKIQILNNDFLGIRGDQEDLLRRIEAIEGQAS